jgi:putative CocE/NonD family hydrolase
MAENQTRADASREVNDVRTVAHSWIAMTDGTRLSAKLWLPDPLPPAGLPAILEYAPYRKDDATSPGDERMFGYFAARGYACVRVDIRGCGDSDGILEGEYLSQEQDDALEVLVWIADQPWSDGGVGMIGLSWTGFNGLQVAARRPPQLKAVISCCSTHDRYDEDIHYMGGCVLGIDMLSWATTMLGYNARPPQPDVVGDAWRENWLRRIDESPPFVEDWLTHQHRDAFWKHGSVGESYNAIDCPLLMVGGWADAYRTTVLRILERYDGPCKGLIGPWSHHYGFDALPGPSIGFLQEALRWWDHWLKGEATGVMEEPALRAWMQDSVRADAPTDDRPGRWVAESEWPPAGREPLALHLAPGVLSDQPHGGSAATVSIVGTLESGVDSGDWLGFGRPVDLPRDQRAEDGRSLSFETQPLAETLEILGMPRVKVVVTSDQSNALMAVRLCDVAPDGSSTLVTRRVFNLTHRGGHEHPSPLVPGEAVAATVELTAIAHSFQPGHQVRLAISPTYWPWAWPSPVTAELTFALRQCSLELPVRPRPAVEPAIEFGEPEWAPGVEVVSSSPTPSRRIISRDVAAGRLTITTDFSYFGHQTYRNGLEYREDMRDIASIAIGDPLSAEVRCERTIALRQGEWDIRVEAWATMSSTAASFMVTNGIDAYESDVRVAAKRWNREIPRDLV